MTQQTMLDCGCIVTKHGGHTHTKLCPACKAKAFGTPPPPPPPPETYDDLL